MKYTMWMVNCCIMNATYSEIAKLWMWYMWLAAPNITYILGDCCCSFSLCWIYSYHRKANLRCSTAVKMQRISAALLFCCRLWEGVLISHGVHCSAAAGRSWKRFGRVHCVLNSLVHCAKQSNILHKATKRTAKHYFVHTCSARYICLRIRNTSLPSS